MSWPTWTAAGAPIPTAMATPVQSTLLQPALNPAPAVLAPMGYNQEQWAQAQQQNWQQWAQWQQQYQQWHQQYGAEYQKSITAMQGVISAPAIQPPLPTTITATLVPPLPSDNKPPLPPEEPPPTQQSVAALAYAAALSKTGQAGYVTSTLLTQQPPTQSLQPTYVQPVQNWQNTAQKRAHPQDSDFDQAKKAMMDKPGNNWNQQKPLQWQDNSQNFSQPPPQVAAPKPNVEELSEAEKKFDKEFAAWEAQFNKWKDQNANHPDKTQYKEYEKKWESWRNSLLERREQMRRKRLASTGQIVAAVAKTQTFNQPPPELQSITAGTPKTKAVLGNKQSLLGQYPGAPATAPQTDLFCKPPPTQNNEPLTFKSQTILLEQENPNSEDGFLKSTSSSGGIPGLDLVKEDTKEENMPDRSDVENDEKDEIKEEDEPVPVNRGPDFEAISKGINTILGDQKLLSMLSMVSQNTPNIPANLITTNTTSVMPPSFGQNFSVPPPALQKFPPGASINETPHSDYPTQDNQSNIKRDEYHRARENFESFNRGGIFSGPPPEIRNNFNKNIGSVRNKQDSFNTRPFERKERLSGEHETFDRISDNVNRNNRFINKFDDNFRGNRNDNFDYDDQDEFEGSRRNFNHPKDFREDNFGRQGNRDNFNRDTDYDDFDHYNEEEEDHDKYDNMFKDEEEEDYHSYRGQNEDIVQQPPPKIPGLMDQIAPAPPHIQPPVEEPLFEPVTVIDYDHKSRRERDGDVIIETCNMFDYRHKPLNRIPFLQRPKWLAEAVKFIREFDPLAARFERPPAVSNDRFSRDEEHFTRFEGRERSFKDREIRNGKPYERADFHRQDRMPYSRDRMRFNERNDFRDDNFNRSTEDRHKQKLSETRRVDSRDDLKKRTSLSREDFEDFSDSDMDFEQSEQVRHNQPVETRKSKSKSPELSNPPNPSSSQLDITMIEDVINPPGRFNRPPRIVIILRGPPGSGKTFLAKQIKDKEMENGGSAPRILSLDDYFMVEQENKVMEDGKLQSKKEMVYEFEAEMEESYRTSFMKSFKKTVTDGYFPFIIVDNVNDKVKHFGEMWSFAKQNGFQVYICQMDLDPVQCAKRNIHNRSVTEIEEIISGWEPTPAHHPTIDASGLLQMCAIADVEMELEEQHPDTTDVKSNDPEDQVRSKWDNFDFSSNNLAKLDGVSKPLRKSGTMEEYLQLEDQWEPPKSTTTGKKRVRWADLEEQKELEKMRAIGFVVGHTNWERMMDPTGGSRALTQTKYIEKVSRY